MNIALIAHDAKKRTDGTVSALRICGVLSRHSLCATGTTGKLVSEANRP
jgi:methylglyoxal synthase